jgi:hypothetical protein
MNDFYATHSPITNPGSYAHLFTGLPRDLAGISRVAQGLVYHYFGDQHIYGYQPPQDRMPEIDTRYMERMLARLIEMDNRPLTESRAYENRLVGCCRDFSLLACSILRNQGTPARSRYGFAAYFIPDYWMDHVIVEVWNGTRWQRFDPRIPASRDWGFDVLDMPDKSFITGGRAWQMIRSEGADPSKFGIGPDVPQVGGEWFIRGRLQLDIAALNKQEMLCWDEWAYSNENSVLTANDHALMDRVAALSLQPDSTELRQFYANDSRLQVPATVTCFSPAVGPHPVKLDEAVIAI